MPDLAVGAGDDVGNSNGSMASSGRLEGVLNEVTSGIVQRLPALGSQSPPEDLSKVKEKQQAAEQEAHALNLQAEQVAHILASQKSKDAYAAYILPLQQGRSSAQAPEATAAPQAAADVSKVKEKPQTAAEQRAAADAKAHALTLQKSRNAYAAYIGSEQQGGSSAQAPEATTAAQAAAADAKVRKVSGEDNDCSLNALRIATGSVPNITCDAVRKRLGFKLGERLNFDQAAMAARDIYGLGGVVAARYPSEHTYMAFPQTLTASQEVAILLNGGCHVDLFEAMVSTPSFQMAVEWLERHGYTDYEVRLYTIPLGLY